MRIFIQTLVEELKHATLPIHHILHGSMVGHAFHLHCLNILIVYDDFKLDSPFPCMSLHAFGSGRLYIYFHIFLIIPGGHHNPRVSLTFYGDHPVNIHIRNFRVLTHPTERAFRRTCRQLACFPAKEFQ